jgi:hypothetical protein
MQWFWRIVFAPRSDFSFEFYRLTGVDFEVALLVTSLVVLFVLPCFLRKDSDA